MEHPKAQIKAITRMRLFIQLTQIPHLALRNAVVRTAGIPKGEWGSVCLLIRVSVCVFVAAEEAVLGNVLRVQVKGHHIPGFSAIMRHLR